MADDPRDPRDPAPSMRKVIEQLNERLDVTLQSQRAVNGELVSTGKETLTALKSMERSLSELVKVAGGSASLPPGTAVNASSIEQQMRHLHQVQDQVESSVSGQAIKAGDGRYRIMDYSLDPTAPLGDQTRKQLRSRVRERVLGAAEAGERRAQEAVNNFEQWQYTIGGDRVMLREGYTMDEAGRYYDPNRRFARAADAVAIAMDEDEHASLAGSVARKAALWGTASRTAAAWQGGAPVGRAVMAGLPQGAMKGLGIAGAAYMVGDQMWGRLQGQAETNRELDAIYGDSGTGFFDQVLGFGNWGTRADRFLNSLRGRFSLIGQENYEKLWNGAAEMALRGGDRDKWIDRGADIIRGTGADADFVNKLFTMATEAGNSIDGLSESLQRVSDVARDAGINAGRAREIFMANYARSSDVLFGSNQVGRFAELQTVAQTQAPHGYQNVDWWNSLQSTTNQIMFGSAMGLTLAQTQAHLLENPLDVIAYSEERAKRLLSTWEGDGSGQHRPFPVAVAAFVDEMQRSGHGYSGDHHAKARLTQFLLQQGYLAMIARAYLNQAGATVSENQALATAGELFIAGQSQGDAMIGEAGRTAERQASMGGTVPTRQVEETTRVGGRAGTTTTRMVTQIDASNEVIPIPTMPTGRGHGGVEDLSDLGQYQSLYYGGAYYKNGTIYGNDNLSNFERDPVLGMLISDPSFKPSEAMVQVATPFGEERVMSLSEAYRLYPGAIRSGEAILVRGWGEDKLGKTIADAFRVSEEIRSGVDPQSGPGWRSVRPNAGGMWDRVMSEGLGQGGTAIPGLSVADFQEKYGEHASEGGSANEPGGGTWELVLSEEAKRLFSVIENPNYSPEPPDGGRTDGR